jgi:hypothetical protein
MSSNQKPGKFKVVGTTPANPGRRIGDGADSGTAPGAATIAARPGAAGQSGKANLLLPALFVLGCATGGAGVVYLGLVAGLSG